MNYHCSPVVKVIHPITVCLHFLGLHFVLLLLYHHHYRYHYCISYLICFSFIRNPTPDAESAPQGVVWPTAGANKNNLTYYVFDHALAEPIYDVKPLHISVVPGKFKDRMDFWDSLPLRENQEE
jgi:hypothetical protein